MQEYNRIGLNIKKSKLLSERLNILLANYQIFYMNTRGFHWNIKGNNFFELHLKFEKLYNDSLIKIDEIAERILTLGYTPLHTYTDFLSAATIKEAKDISNGERAIKVVLEGYETLLPLEKESLDLASNLNSEGTNALMSDYIREWEKSVWMYSAYIN